LDVIAREAQITEQLNLLRGLELSQAQARLASERELVEVHYQIKRLTRLVEADRGMVDGGAAPRAELAGYEEDLEYNRQRLQAIGLRARRGLDLQALPVVLEI